MPFCLSKRKILLLSFIALRIFLARKLLLFLSDEKTILEKSLSCEKGYIYEKFLDNSLVVHSNCYYLVSLIILKNKFQVHDL